MDKVRKEEREKEIVTPSNGPRVNVKLDFQP